MIGRGLVQKGCNASRSADTAGVSSHYIEHDEARELRLAEEAGLRRAGLRRAGEGGRVASPFERPRRPWATGGGRGGGFFRGIVRVGIVKTLNSFNFDVLGDI
jgi:hypothetical protein